MDACMQNLAFDVALSENKAVYLCNKLTNYYNSLNSERCLSFSVKNY